MIKSLFALLLAAVPALAAASGGGELKTSFANIADQSSLQRGAALYMNYCSGCHALSMQRYARTAADLGLSESQMMDNLNFSGAKFGEQIKVAMDPADAEAWFGKTPPDLSLVARNKPGGPDWTYTFLKSFYVDESRPSGWNNTLLPNASMPNVLWELQGAQQAATEPKHKNDKGQTEACHGPEVRGECFTKFETPVPGKLNAEQFDRAARDIATFLTYVGEPAALQREATGVWVILFLAVFTLLAYLLKHEYWKDVH